MSSQGGAVALDGEFRGLIVDWGGVLTNDISSAMSAWADVESVNLADLGRVMGQWLGPNTQAATMVNPVHALERGEMAVPHFEERLADELASITGQPVNADGLLERLFGAFESAPDMNALVRRARQAGISTALLSNSWGNRYPDHLFDGMFDAVVISGQVGMRKPDAEIYYYTLDQVQLSPKECVFVDDMAHNVTAAVGLGMAGIVHTSYRSTASELEAIFGCSLT